MKRNRGYRIRLHAVDVLALKSVMRSAWRDCRFGTASATAAEFPAI
jgi:hypothetical protein